MIEFRVSSQRSTDRHSLAGPERANVTLRFTVPEVEGSQPELCVTFANIEATSGRRNQLEVTCSSMPPWTALPSFRSMLSGCGGSGGIGRPIHMSLFQAMSYQSSRSTGSGLSFQNLSLSWYCIMHSDTKKHSYSYHIINVLHSYTVYIQ